MVATVVFVAGNGCGGAALLVGADPDGGTPGTGDSGLKPGSGSDAGARAEGGAGACKSDADCPSVAHCGYRIGDGCSAEAQCVYETQMPCTPLGVSCACDGTDFDVDCAVFPQGYAQKPIAHAGSCADAGGDAGLPCIRDADCASGFLCGYAAASGCTATGTCVAQEGGFCNAIVPGCACDGTSFNTICGGLPSGYVSKPMAYEGACSDAGGTFACGSQTCTPKQYCLDMPPGVESADGGTVPDAFACTDLPAACLNEATCTCIQTNTATGGQCSIGAPGVTCGGSAGAVTVKCLGE